MGAFVLLYHRLGGTASDPWALSVSERNFADHMAAIAGRLRPCRLRDVLSLSAQSAGQREGVVVTFDDGYASCLHAALPVLEAHGIPATCFIPSIALDRRGEWWWDELAAIILESAWLPATPPEELRWLLDPWPSSFRGEAAEADAPGSSWRAWSDAPKTDRQVLYLGAWSRLREVAPAVRERALGDLRSWAKIPDGLRPSYACMTLDQARRLCASSLVEIGGHTRTHARLSSLVGPGLRDEIAGNKADLEHWLGMPVRTFSYPFGRPGHDYTGEAVAVANDAGIKYACSNTPGAVTPATTPLEIPRLFVQDWEADDLLEQIARLG